MSACLFQLLAVVGDVALLVEGLDLEGERDHDFRKADLVRHRLQVLEDAAVNLLHGRVFEAILDQLRFRNLETAAEVHRLHGQLRALLAEVVLVQDVKVVRQDGDELLCVARNLDQLRAKVETNRVVLRSVDEPNGPADDLDQGVDERLQGF